MRKKLIILIFRSIKDKIKTYIFYKKTKVFDKKIKLYKYIIYCALI